MGQLDAKVCIVTGAAGSIGFASARAMDNEFQTDIEDRLGKRVGIDATQMINQAIPLKRHASAAEIAGTVLFLASDQSSFSTGSGFMADGGLNA